MPNCELCGEPMSEAESMFKYHGYSGPCPKPPLPRGPTPTERLVRETVRTARDNALDAAIQLCEEFARTGDSIESAIRALRDLKTMMPQPPSTGH